MLPSETFCEALNEVKDLLEERHPSLVVTESICDASPYLHFWRPKAEPKTLKFLPEFHVVATASYDDEKEVIVVEFKLYTFNGKRLDQEALQLAELQDKDVVMLMDLQGEKLELCQGISGDQLNYLIKNFKVDSSSGESVLEKVRQSFLIETLADEVQFRSQSCELLREVWKSMQQLFTSHPRGVRN